MRWTLSVCGRDGSLNGTVMRSPVSSDQAIPAASKGKIQTKFFTVFSPGNLFLPVTNSNISVEGIELELGTSMAHAHSVKLMALINELAVVLLAHRGPAGKRSDIEVRVGLPVESLQPDVGRKVGAERHLHVAVQRSEIACARRIAAEQHLKRTVQCVSVARACNFHQIHAAIDVLDVECARGIFHADVPMVDRSQPDVRIARRLHGEIEAHLVAVVARPAVGKRPVAALTTKRPV